jgi:hypothetical protein
MNCAICNSEPSWVWTDTHGVAQCWTCGTPYRLLHYEGEGDDRKRVEKAPEIRIKAEYVPVLKAYWDEKRRRMPSGHSIPGGQEIATRADAEALNNWMEENAERLLSAND